MYNRLDLVRKQLRRLRSVVKWLERLEKDLKAEAKAEKARRPVSTEWEEAARLRK